MKRTRLFLFVLLLLLSGTLFAQNNIFVRMWSDVNAYFNTFYNAKVYFKEAQEMYNAEEDKSQMIARTRTMLNKAAKHAELVIDKFPNSSFVDDAMFYYSICHFQLGRFENALQQLQTLTLRYPDSRYYYEARLWISRCYFELNQKAIAYDLLEQFMDNPRNRAYFSDAYSLMGQLALQEGDSAKALDAFLLAADQASEKGMRCNMYLEAVDIQLAKAQYDEALRNTDRALRNIRFDEQRARTHLAYIRIYHHRGENDKAEEYVETALKDARIAKYWGDVMNEEANIYFNTGQREKAVARLRYIVEDPENTYRNNRDSHAWARAAYRLGKYYIYENAMIDSAEFYFGRAQTRRRQVREGVLANEFILTINQLKSIYNTMNNFVNKFPALADTALAYYHLLSDSAHAELNKEELLLADTLSLDSTGTDSLLRQTAKPEFKRYRQTLSQYKEAANGYTQSLFSLAGMMLFDLHLPDSTLRIYERVSREFTFTPFIPQALYSQAYLWEHELNNKAKADSIKSYIIEHYPESDFTYHIMDRVPKDSLIYHENQNKIFEIEKRYVDNGKYADAIEALKELLHSENLDEKNHAHVAYKIAWLYDHEISKSHQVKDSTLAYYHLVRDRHPNSPYTSRTILRIAAIETRYDDKPDTSMIDVAETGLITDESSDRRADGRRQYPIRRQIPSPARPRPERL
ncbi:MAG: tetratricopeptide repeat protein [FCB group bacterium]|nr:tetratricopeptide repeat protein [FCB group bacterium]